MGFCLGGFQSFLAGADVPGLSAVLGFYGVLDASRFGIPGPVERAAEPTDENIRALVYGFYDRVRADPLLGPVFDAKLAGRWDDHLPKMCTFWGSLVLGAKQYRGNVQQAHQPLEGIEPQHFSRWLYLFLDTVESRYQPAAAIRFMEPALRIASHC